MRRPFIQNRLTLFHQSPSFHKCEGFHPMASAIFPGDFGCLIPIGLMFQRNYFYCCRKSATTSGTKKSRGSSQTSEYHLLAGFDEDLLQDRIGYLDQIHIIVRFESSTPPTTASIDITAILSHYLYGQIDSPPSFVHCRF